MSTAILWPTFLLVLLIFTVLIALATQRFRHVRANPPRREDLATGVAAKAYFAPVEMPANNLANPFEMPVLYFALVPLLLLFRHANHIQLLLAWIFVILRMVHSLIHVRSGKVNARFLIYLASCLVLSAMWVGFAIDMATASIALANQGAL
jgi:hypothetical protein